MLSRWRSNPQPRLLERYWTALRRERAAAPPAGLDPELGRLAQRLAADVERLDPPDTVVAELRQRLVPPVATNNNHRARAWSGPAVDPTQQRRTARAIKEAEERVIMSDITHAKPEPIPLAQRRWFREGLKIAAAALIFGVIGAILALTLRDNDNEQAAVTIPTPTMTVAPTTTAVPTVAEVAPTQPAPTATRLPATATAAPSPTPTLPPAGTSTTITVGRSPYNIAIDTNAIWVTNADDGTVSRIDPDTNQVVATIQLADPVAGENNAAAVAVGDGAVWATTHNGSQMVRIDPDTNQVTDTFDLGAGIYSLVYGNGALWGQSFASNALMRVDTQTHAVTTIAVDAPWAVVATDGALWVPRQLQPADIVKIDMTTNTIVVTVPLGAVIYPQVVSDGDTVWTMTPTAVLRIDAASGQIAATISLPAGFTDQTGQLLAGDGTAWLVGATTLWRLDPTTSQWTALGSVPALGNVRQTWFGNGSFWIAMIGNTVVRLEVPS